MVRSKLKIYEELISKTELYIATALDKNLWIALLQ